MKKAIVFILGVNYSILGLTQIDFNTKTEESLNFLNRPETSIAPFKSNQKFETVFNPETPVHSFHSNSIQPELDLLDEDIFEEEKKNRFKPHFFAPEGGSFFRNRRNIYSSLWAYASLNYLYADLVGLMDQNYLTQYYEGTVNGIDISPNFLTGAGAFMQIPLANVFLPQVIKNERVLRWVQIASGSVMTLVQGSTLFVGKPAPYYVLFSALEMAATTFITVDAIKWKPKKREINTHL